MNKMYRVFVSSTYEDLKDERIAVMRTLVSVGCLPVGMEYFQAADTTTMHYIEQQIDTCDFYVLIVAGRYGSIDYKKRISYTEYEYKYAEKHKIPIFAFVHSDIKKLPYGKVQVGELDKLDKFKNQVSCKNIARWHDIHSLTDAVRSSIYAATETYNHLGYIYGNRTDISIPLTQNFSNREVTDRILASKETFIFGLGCPTIMRTLEDRTNSMLNIVFPRLKILLMNPHGEASKIAKLRAGGIDGRLDNYYEKNSEVAIRLPYTELRHIEYLPPYNMFIFDPDDDEKGEIIVHIAGWRTPSDNGRPALHLYKSNNAFWFDYFLDQFNRMWEFAINNN